MSRRRSPEEGYSSRGTRRAARRCAPRRNRATVMPPPRDGRPVAPYETRGYRQRLRRLPVNVVHLAHLQDTTYPIAGVRTETNSLTAAGFPMMRIEVDGGHYDAAGAMENGHAVPGTSADVATYLFPLLSAGWSAP